MTKQRAISSAALSTSWREKNSALGLPVVPLEVCRRERPSSAHGEQAVGISGAQVGVGGERQPAQVGQRLDVLWPQTGLGELLLVERHAAGDAAHGRLQTFQLELL